MDLLKNIMPKVLRSYKLEPASEAALRMFEFEQVLAQQFGMSVEELKKNVLIVSFEKQILQLKVKNAMWAQNLHLLKDDLLNNMRQEEYKTKVLDLKIGLL